MDYKNKYLILKNQIAGKLDNLSGNCLVFLYNADNIINSDNITNGCIYNFELNQIILPNNFSKNNLKSQLKNLEKNFTYNKCKLDWNTNFAINQKKYQDGKTNINNEINYLLFDKNKVQGEINKINKKLNSDQTDYNKCKNDWGNKIVDFNNESYTNDIIKIFLEYFRRAKIIVNKFANVTASNGQFTIIKSINIENYQLVELQTNNQPNYSKSIKEKNTNQLNDDFPGPSKLWDKKN